MLVTDTQLKYPKKWQDTIFTIFDLEWTNLKHKNYIIEIGALKVKNGQVIDQFNKILFFKDKLDSTFKKITKITDEMVRYGENRKKTISEFALFIENTVLVAHNIQSDLTVLKEEFKRFNLSINSIDEICTLKLAQKMILNPKYKLIELAYFFNLKPFIVHRAFADAKLLYEVFGILINHLPNRIKNIQHIQNYYSNKSNKILIKFETELIRINKKIMEKIKFKGFFDGASAGNPGHIGIGFVVFSEKNTKVFSESKYIGIGTNNEAEYQALIGLLKFAVENGIKNLAVYGDSKLVINQMNKEWAVRAVNLQKFFQEAQELLSNFDEVSFQWVPRNKNNQADELAKNGITMK